MTISKFVSSAIVALLILGFSCISALCGYMISMGGHFPIHRPVVAGLVLFIFPIFVSLMWLKFRTRKTIFKLNGRTTKADTKQRASAN